MLGTSKGVIVIALREKLRHDSAEPLMNLTSLRLYNKTFYHSKIFQGLLDTVSHLDPNLIFVCEALAMLH